MFRRIKGFWQRGPVRLWFWVALAAVTFDALYNSIGCGSLLEFALRFCAWFVAAGAVVSVLIGSLFGAAHLADHLPHGRMRWVAVPLLIIGAFAFGGWLFPKMLESVPHIGWRVTALVRSIGEAAD